MYAVDIWAGPVPHYGRGASAIGSVVFLGLLAAVVAVLGINRWRRR